MSQKGMFYTYMIGEGRQPSQSDDMSKTPKNLGRTYDLTLHEINVGYSHKYTYHFWN